MKGKQILLIEDEKNVADVIIQGLEEDGASVLHATNYERALHLLQTNNIDIVILDVLLPETNGLDICKNFRTLGYTNLPILMVTALGGPENVV